MKKIIYTIAFYVAASSVALSQTVIKETKEEIADLMLFGNDLVVYTRKEDQGQYIYTEQRGRSESAKKDPSLNAGIINTVIGRNLAANELFVYQKNGRHEELIAVFTLHNGNFVKTAAQALPKLTNHSYNLGLFLSEDKNTLLISAELSKSRGYDDLYLSRWENNRWTRPENLGRAVNTRQQEFAPFLANDSLYFSRKEAAIAYVYVVPFNKGQITGEATKLDAPINLANSYNAYYKKQDAREIWITASADKAVSAAYMLEKPAPVAKEAVVEEAPVVETLVAPELVVKKKTAAPGLTVYYGINRIHLSQQAVPALTKFLNKQPQGTSFVIKGYSDGYGNAEAKDYVSRNRALQVQQHIEQYFPEKKFSVILEREVSDKKGKANRKTEIYLMQ